MSDHRGRPMSTFFFDMFSTISKFSIFPKKVIGPDASENVLGRPGGSGELLGASGGGRGGVLGGSWALLGRSWSDLGGSPISDRFFDRFGAPKGCPKGGILGAKMEPKSIPK